MARKKSENIEEIKKSGGIAMVLYPKDFENFKKLITFIKNEQNINERIII